MNKTYIIIIILIGLLLGGTWYGVSQWRRSQALQGDRDLLLINKKDKAYSFLSSSDLEDIDRRFKIAGFVDELTQEEIDELTEGLTIAGSFPSGVGELPGFPNGSAEVEAPEDRELGAWQTFTTTLTEEQLSFCGKMPTASLSQFCLIRHGVYQALQSNAPTTICEGIFLDSERERCVSDLTDKNLDSVIDADGDTFIDSFDIYIGKSDFFIRTE